MTKESFSFLLRDLPVYHRRVLYAFGAVLLLYQSAPVLAGVLAAPAAIHEMSARLDVLEERIARDSARQERMLCMQEVVAGIRPEIDLQTRCAR
jgi:hypothetical protein